MLRVLCREETWGSLYLQLKFEGVAFAVSVRL